MRKLISILYMGLACCVLFSCNKLLSEQVPQAGRGHQLLLLDVEL